VHHELISQFRGALGPSLRPRYAARVELRVYVTDQDDPGLEVIIPDVRIEETLKNGGKKHRRSNGATATIAEPIELPILIDEIKEARIEIRTRESGNLVTIIELMSPSNKVAGSRGRESYMNKKREALASEVNWVEIDLLRGGLASRREPFLRPCDYRVFRYRSHAHGDYWPIDLRQALPVIGIPLRGKDPDVPLDLGATLNAAYDRAGYDLTIDYSKEANPPLKGADRSWADKLLREHGLR
jgi:hypothetical protein